MKPLISFKTHVEAHALPDAYLAIGRKIDLNLGYNGFYFKLQLPFRVKSRLIDPTTFDFVKLYPIIVLVIRRVRITGRPWRLFKRIEWAS